MLTKRRQATEEKHLPRSASDYFNAHVDCIVGCELNVRWAPFGSCFALVKVGKSGVMARRLQL